MVFNLVKQCLHMTGHAYIPTSFPYAPENVPTLFGYQNHTDIFNYKKYDLYIKNNVETEYEKIMSIPHPTNEYDRVVIEVFYNNESIIDLRLMTTPDLGFGYATHYNDKNGPHNFIADTDYAGYIRNKIDGIR